MEVKMKFKKSTPHTHVYTAIVEAVAGDVFLPPISTLYIRKSALTGAPQKITLTVTYDE